MEFGFTCADACVTALRRALSSCRTFANAGNGGVTSSGRLCVRSTLLRVHPFLLVVCIRCFVCLVHESRDICWGLRSPCVGSFGNSSSNRDGACFHWGPFVGAYGERSLAARTCVCGCVALCICISDVFQYSHMYGGATQLSVLCLYPFVPLQLLKTPFTPS